MKRGRIIWHIYFALYLPSFIRPYPRFFPGTGCDVQRRKGYLVGERVKANNRMSEPQSRWDLGPWWHHQLPKNTWVSTSKLQYFTEIKTYSTKPLRSNFYYMHADTITNIYTAQVLLTMGDTTTFLCHKSTLANVTEQPGLWFSFCTVLVVGKQQTRIIDDSKCF